MLKSARASKTFLNQSRLLCSRLYSSVSQHKVSQSRSEIKVDWPEGQSSTFHYIWLRDHCPSNYHEFTKQRMVDTASIPLDIEPSNIKVDETGIQIDWPALAQLDQQKSHFTWDWLKKCSYNPPLETLKTNNKEFVPGKLLWTSQISNNVPRVEYKDVMESDQGVREWLENVNKFGFCFVQNVPPTPEDTEKLAERIAFIRPTHYGGFWDFTADLAHGDTAYTDIALRAHTDNTYFSDPAGLQMFHLLSPRTTHKGGHSLLVDGFHAALKLRELNPSYYRLFSTLPIPAHASGGPSTLIKPHIDRPVFEHDGDDILKIVRWNGDDRDMIGKSSEWQGEWENSGKCKVQVFYEALQAWEQILRSPELEYWTALEPGQALIFDNQRVLHGRSSFSGQRRLCGAYINGDDWRSRLRTLQRQN